MQYVAEMVIHVLHLFSKRINIVYQKKTYFQAKLRKWKWVPLMVVRMRLFWFSIHATLYLGGEMTKMKRIE